MQVNPTIDSAAAPVFETHQAVRHDHLGVGLPANTTVELRRLSHPDLMVEIEAIAVKDRP
ncbi:MAG: hypothetical protein WCC81_24835 [Pseudolabrys sp.]